MKSMTGFGGATVDMLRVELKSLNSKGLDMRFKLPDELKAEELGYRAEVKKILSRGRVELFVSVESGATGVLHIDKEAAASAKDQAEKLAAELGIENDLRLSDLLRLPGVITAAKSVDLEALVESGKQALKQALDELSRSREGEGKGLFQELETRVQVIETLTQKIAGVAKKTPEQMKEKLHQRASQWLDDKALDAGRLHQEIAFLIDKIDVNEEVSRLAIHCDRFTAIMKENGPVGRKLDFLCQEFMREANTIGSKCQDANVSVLVVDLKNEIEKLREQVQNVE